VKKKGKQNMKMNDTKQTVKKLPFNVQTNVKMKKSIEGNTKLYVKMNDKMKLNTMVHMGNIRYCCALAAEQLSNVRLCASPYLVMSTAEAYLLTVSGDRDEQCKWYVFCDVSMLPTMELGDD
jgi:hypothetical protein